MRSARFPDPRAQRGARAEVANLGAGGERADDRGAERLEVKMWVLGPTTPQDARRQRDELPRDLLLCAGPRDESIGAFDTWFDRPWDGAGDVRSSLIWLDGRVEVLDPTGGYDASGHLRSPAPTSAGAR